MRLLKPLYSKKEMEELSKDKGLKKIDKKLRDPDA